MLVNFVRTGERRYAVEVTPDGAGPRRKDPAPGFDPEIPHDLVHYVVEAELGLQGALYGRMAEGGGDFVAARPDDRDPRARSRERRRQLRRDAHLRDRDHVGGSDMERAERLAGVVDVLWRRRHGQRPDGEVGVRGPEVEPADREDVERVLARLDEAAALWRTIQVGEALEVRWPSVDFVVSPSSAAARSGHDR